MHATLPRLQNTDFPALTRAALETLQVNLGYRCNQQCLHCHVAASPRRTEVMDSRTVDDVLDFVRRSGVGRLDVTGGAPELNSEFRRLVATAAAAGVQVIDRCNLTVLFEPGQEDLAAFLAHHRVEIVASLPCYLEENVDSQRGAGVFRRSIEALRRLNQAGFGMPGTGLVLNLMYNPRGPALPPPQPALEADYRRILGEHHGVRFNSLYTLTNMPIRRFGSTLISKGQFDSYMALLKNAHQPCNLAGVMCRTLVSVDWRGFVYDCDFNQMLELPLATRTGQPVHIRDLDPQQLDGRPIRVADHCYGCTAGQGSSCGGAINS